MAGGEGGFSTKPMGFDKTEVNDYIAKLNQRMKEIEADKKVNDEKTQTALKKAQDADKTIKAVKAEYDRKVSELELQVKTDKKNMDSLTMQIDDLKRKLKLKTAGDASSVKVSERKAAEIIEKANATANDIVKKANKTAKDTVEEAKSTAHQILSDVQGVSGGISSANADEFMRVLAEFMDKVTKGVNEVNSKASELLGTQAAEPIELPDFSNISAPQAKVPNSESVSAVTESADSKKKSALDADVFAELDEPSVIDEELEEFVSEVQPLEDPNKATGAVVLDEFDLSESVNLEDFNEPVTEVKPISQQKRGKADLSDDFETQILAQTANSSSLRRDMGDEMFAAVKQQEEQFAVKPTKSVADFDMDDAAEDEDPLSAMLKQAELTFGSGANASEKADEKPNNTVEEAPKPETKEDDSNPWAALQNELLAMEKSGNLGSADDEEIGLGTETEDPVAPSADDSSIWDFGSDSIGSSNDDNDMSMSEDLFGSFDL